MFAMFFLFSINASTTQKGGHVEVQYALMQFGIPISNLHIDHEGNLDKKFVLQLVEQYRVREAAAARTRQQQAAGTASGNSDSAMIEIATDNDVLLGRGKPYQSHPGNVLLSQLIKERLDEFHNAPKVDKTVITWQIVTRMREDYNGRFLERVATAADDSTSTTTGGSGGWKECSNEVARIKVAYGFRSRVKMQRKRGSNTDAAMSLSNGGCGSSPAFTPEDAKRVTKVARK